MKCPKIKFLDKDSEEQIITIERSRIVPVVDERFVRGRSFEGRSDGELRGLGFYLDINYDHVVVLDSAGTQVLVRLMKEGTV